MNTVSGDDDDNNNKRVRCSIIRTICCHIDSHITIIYCGTQCRARLPAGKPSRLQPISSLSELSGSDSESAMNATKQGLRS
jgi:hypothetical protein